MNIAHLIERPTLLLDRGRVQANIARIRARASLNHVAFRPHFKTHQAAEIGYWFREQGITAITVSSLAMARYFAHHGWNDITVAFPANVREMKIINELADRIHLNLLVESADTVEQLDRRLAHPVRAWIKIDIGNRRTGIDWQDNEGVTAVAQAVERSRHLRLAGILTHDGGTYQTRGRSAVESRYREALKRIVGVQRHLREGGIEAAISVGDTPAASLVEDLGPIDEIRPGNFVFYDLMQLEIGACREQDIAVALACPVVARHASRLQLVIYGGAVHLSKEALRLQDGREIYGRVARISDRGWSEMVGGAEVVNMSQEHGLVQVDRALFDDVRVGDLLAILPVHSCLTANLIQNYVTTDGQHIQMFHFARD